MLNEIEKYNIISFLNWEVGSHTKFSNNIYITLKESIFYGMTATQFFFGNPKSFIRHRSSILRCGSFITSGVYDPGFEVEQMGAVMFVEEELYLEKGARVAQVIVLENTNAELYSGQWQGSKDLK